LGCASSDGGTAIGQGFPCTEEGIRAAVAAGGGPHTFLCDGPQTVATSAEIEINQDVILDGEGNLTVDGAGDHRVFMIRALDPLDVLSVELLNMGITGGFVASCDPNVETCGVGGAAIFTYHELTLIGCTISGNRAANVPVIESVGEPGLFIIDSMITENEGESIISYGGEEMMIEGSTISNNKGTAVVSGALFGFIGRSIIADNGGPTTEYGGGVLSFGDFTIWTTSVTGNQAVRGGGVFNAGDLRVAGSTIAGNTAVEGGGIFNNDPFVQDRPVTSTGVLVVDHTTVSGNVAERGGGIYTAGLWQRIENSTVSGNMADIGGGIAVAGTQEGPSSLALANATIAANAAESGSAIWAGGDSPEVRFVGSIVDGGCDQAEGAVSWVSNGGNLESPGDTCGFAQATDQTEVSVDALRLGPLADNGGNTETHAPEPGSAAIDAMSSEDCAMSLNDPRVDQRFINRPMGSGCDAGSIEVEQ
jgi:predicted outer membrane repeat protein